MYIPVNVLKLTHMSNLDNLMNNTDTETQRVQVAWECVWVEKYELLMWSRYLRHYRSCERVVVVRGKSYTPSGTEPKIQDT